MMINILKGASLWMIGIVSMFALSEGVQWAVIATSPIVSIILMSMDTNK